MSSRTNSKNPIGRATAWKIGRHVELHSLSMNASTSPLPPILLGLFVLNLAIAFGAGVYEHRIVLGRWIETAADGSVHWNAAAAVADDSGRRFWAFVTTVPLTLLTLANVYLAWRAPAGVRPFWLAAALLAFVDRGLTFGYFIPTALELIESGDTREAVATAIRWRTMNHLRHALTLLGSVGALTAFWALASTRAVISHR